MSNVGMIGAPYNCASEPWNNFSWACQLCHPFEQWRYDTLRLSIGLRVAGPWFATYNRWFGSLPTLGDWESRSQTPLAPNFIFRCKESFRLAFRFKHLSTFTSFLYIFSIWKVWLALQVATTSKGRKGLALPFWTEIWYFCYWLNSVFNI